MKIFCSDKYLLVQDDKNEVSICQNENEMDTKLPTVRFDYDNLGNGILCIKEHGNDGIDLNLRINCFWVVYNELLLDIFSKNNTNYVSQMMEDEFLKKNYEEHLLNSSEFILEGNQAFVKEVLKAYPGCIDDCNERQTTVRCYQKFVDILTYNGELCLKIYNI